MSLLTPGEAVAYLEHSNGTTRRLALDTIRRELARLSAIEAAALTYVNGHNEQRRLALRAALGLPT
jgi:cysteine sulfinate desulfinase/cysteine desulfurase-like protein